MQKPTSTYPFIFRTERYMTKPYCSLTRRCCQHSHCGHHIAYTLRCIDHWYNETGCQDKLHTSSLLCQIKQSTVITSDLTSHNRFARLWLVVAFAERRLNVCQAEEVDSWHNANRRLSTQLRKGFADRRVAVCSVV